MFPLFRKNGCTALYSLITLAFTVHSSMAEGLLSINNIYENVDACNVLKYSFVGTDCCTHYALHVLPHGSTFYLFLFLFLLHCAHLSPAVVAHVDISHFLFVPHDFIAIVLFSH